MDRKQAIERFNNHLLKIQQPYMYKEDIQAVKTAIKSMDKLDKIEQIIKSRDGFYLYDNLPPFQQIREVLENE